MSLFDSSNAAIGAILGAYSSERAGANDSSSHNYIKGNGWDNYVRLPFRYLLPIGWGRDRTQTDYRLEGGLLTSGATGGESLNPLTSGKTTVGLMPFYRSLSVSSPGLDRSQKTNGVTADLTWDNRDFVTNPSLGQSIKLSFSRDPGWFDSTNSWSFVEAEVDQYFSLGSTERFGFGDTAHYLAPVLVWNMGRYQALKISPAFGLTANSDRMLLRFGYTFEVSGFGQKVSHLFGGR